MSSTRVRFVTHSGTEYLLTQLPYSSLNLMRKPAGSPVWVQAMTDVVEWSTNPTRGESVYFRGTNPLRLDRAGEYTLTTSPVIQRKVCP